MESMQITEIIDRLFLELSQFTQATTAKELALAAEVKTLRAAIKPFADLVMSTSGRVPYERLSAADWHGLTKAYGPKAVGSNYGLAGTLDAGKTKEKMEPILNFGEALQLLKDGMKVARRGWNGKGLWLELQVPDAHSKMTLPYIFMSYPADAQNTPGARVPWLASQTDMLGDDWHRVA
jgi:hypothetical protein